MVDEGGTNNNLKHHKLDHVGNCGEFVLDWTDPPVHGISQERLLNI